MTRPTLDSTTAEPTVLQMIAQGLVEAVVELLAMVGWF